jgi:hypothetical protein
LLISLALVRPLGIVGVAWGTAIPHVGFCLYAVTHACRLTHVRPSNYWRQWIWPAVLTGLPTAIWLTQTWNRPPTGWGDFFSIGLFGMVPYAAMALAVEGRPWIKVAFDRSRRMLAAVFRHSAAR